MFLPLNMINGGSFWPLTLAPTRTDVDSLPRPLVILEHGEFSLTTFVPNGSRQKPDSSIINLVWFFFNFLFFEGIFQKRKYSSIINGLVAFFLEYSSVSGYLRGDPTENQPRN